MNKKRTNVKKTRDQVLMLHRESMLIVKYLVYFILAPSANKVKIGVTSRTAQDRMNDLIPCPPVPLKVLKTIKGTPMMEKALHIKFKEYHSHREWFNYCGKLKAFIDKI